LIAIFELSGSVDPFEKGTSHLLYEALPAGLLLLRFGLSLIAPLAPPIVSGMTIEFVSMRLSALRAIS
jgi:hypothetical protein